MHPYLFHFRLAGQDHAVAGYGVMILLGMTLGLFVGSRRGPRYGVEPFDVLAIGLLVCVSGVVGAASLYIAINFHDFLARPREYLQAPGMVFYGGFVAVLPALAYARRYRVSLAAVADAGAPALPLGHAFGRIGCFLGGCCYGKPTRSFLGVVFDPRTPAGQASLAGPIHPVQLYESAGLLALSLALWAISRRFPPKVRGGLFLLYLALYALLRFAMESLRGDDVERKFAIPGLLSTSQAIAIGMLGCALALYLVARRRAHHPSTETA